MERWVEISFDCLPLRSIGRFEIPIDASPKYQAHCERVKGALEQHGSHNSYYLYNARCVYHLANSDKTGMIEFRFTGAILTDADDLHADRCDLVVELAGETCSWLTEPVVHWFEETVSRSVAVEFNRYIAAGDLQKTVERIAKLQADADDAGGYVGMYL